MASLGGGRIALIALTSARATSLEAIAHTRAASILLPIELAAVHDGSRCRFLNLNRIARDGTHERRRLAEVLAEAAVWGAVSAVIVDPYSDPELRAELSAMGKQPVRLVYAAAGAPPLPLSISQAVIASDDIGWTAAQHLLEAGYEEIIAWQPFTAPWFPERIDKARSACAAARR